MNFLNELGLDPQVRNFVFLGEAGSGKSEIAINFARLLSGEGGRPVHFFDLDMIKPLFRSRDQRVVLEHAGIRFHFEEQFMDAPIAAGGVREQLRDDSALTVLDVGGDYIGARAIGGYAPLLNRPNTVVYYVMNPFRPWSDSLERIDTVLGETLGVSHVQLEQLHLVGNPNLGPETTAEHVKQGMRDLTEMVSSYKNFDFFCVRDTLYDEVKDGFPFPLFPIQLTLTYPWSTTVSRVINRQKEM